MSSSLLQKAVQRAKFWDKKLTFLETKLKSHPEREFKALLKSEESRARKQGECNGGSADFTNPFGISLKNNILKLVKYNKLYGLECCLGFSHSLVCKRKKVGGGKHNNVHLNPSLVENFKLSYGKMTYLTMPLG